MPFQDECKAVFKILIEGPLNEVNTYLDPVESLLRKLDASGRNLPVSWLGNRTIAVMLKEGCNILGPVTIWGTDILSPKISNTD